MAKVKLVEFLTIVVAAVVVLVNAGTKDIAREAFDETSRCMPPMESIPTLLACYHEVTGTQFNHKTTKTSDVTLDVKIKVVACTLAVYGIMSDDGKTFNNDLAQKNFDNFDATEEIKAALKKDIVECGTKGEAIAIATCFHEMFIKNCS